MKANPAHQQRLVEIAELDLKVEQIEQLLKNPPGAQRVKELLASRTELNQTLLQLMAVSDEVDTELNKLASDVELVNNRLKRDHEQLQKQSDPKAALGFEREIESLKNRLSLLEDQQLVLLERQEDAAAAVNAQQELITAVNAEGARISNEAKAIISDSKNELEQLKRDRTAMAESIDSQLIDLYTKLRHRGNAGAAELRARTCQGCHMVLSGNDLEEIAHVDSDELAFCPDCGCILIRTAESGL